MCFDLVVLTSDQQWSSMLGLSTSLVDLNKNQEKEVKLRKISKMKRLSSEQIADLFNVTAGEAIQYDIVISYRLRRESWWETSQTRLIEGRGSLGSG